MSTTEIRTTLDRLSRDERFFAAAYLHHLAQAEDESWRADIQNTMTGMDGGRKFSFEQVRSMHESLAAQGI